LTARHTRPTELTGKGLLGTFVPKQTHWQGAPGTVPQAIRALGC